MKIHHFLLSQCYVILIVAPIITFCNSTSIKDGMILYRNATSINNQNLNILVDVIPTLAGNLLASHHKVDHFLFENVINDLFITKIDFDQNKVSSNSQINLKGDTAIVLANVSGEGLHFWMKFNYEKRVLGWKLFYGSCEVEGKANTLIYKQILNSTDNSVDSSFSFVVNKLFPTFYVEFGDFEEVKEEFTKDLEVFLNMKLGESLIPYFTQITEGMLLPWPDSFEQYKKSITWEGHIVISNTFSHLSFETKKNDNYVKFHYDTEIKMEEYTNRHRFNTSNKTVEIAAPFDLQINISVPFTIISLLNDKNFLNLIIDSNSCRQNLIFEKLFDYLPSLEDEHSETDPFKITCKSKMLSADPIEVKQFQYNLIFEDTCNFYDYGSHQPLFYATMTVNCTVEITAVYSILTALGEESVAYNYTGGIPILNSPNMFTKWMSSIFEVEYSDLSFYGGYIMLPEIPNAIQSQIKCGNGYQILSFKSTKLPI